jgi:hypothetical protein
MSFNRDRSNLSSLPLKRSLPAAWPSFERKLAEALDVLEEDQYLVVSTKRDWIYVQFAAQGSFGLRAECVGNGFLDDAHKLNAKQMAVLRKIGWSSPTGTPEKASPKRQPEGSPNFFRDFEKPVPCADVARMAVRALTEVFEIPHPGYLMYKAFDKKKRTILVPTLGLKHEESEPTPEKPREETIEELRKLVLAAVRDGSGNPGLACAENGDIGLRFGSAAVYVRVLEGPPCVRMFSPVLENVEENDRLLDRLNELNVEMRLVRFFLMEGRVIVAMEMFVEPFVAEHVKRACLVLGSLADEFGGTLQKEFGGKRAFKEGGAEPVQ